MRDAFARELEAVAAVDDRVVLLSGDIGNRMFNSFRDRWPDRFYNCGVAEANMMSVAAGMGLCGLRPVVYTIVPFVTTRCLEQIRVDVCYHHSPVTIVGVGGGLSYAELGATHHSCEDIAFLRELPGMRVLCPADAHEVRGAFRAAVSGHEPTYIRIGKKGEPLLHAAPPDYQIGEPLVLRAGTEVCVLATGNIVSSALGAAESLAVRGISVRVISFHTVKPLNATVLADLFREFRLVVTVEEHSLLGGLGGAVAEWLTDHQLRMAVAGGSRHGDTELLAQLLRIGSPDAFFHRGGSESFARAEWGLDAPSLARRIEETWRALGSQRGRT